jgi:superfamily I DNA/RNA helicase
VAPFLLLLRCALDPDALNEEAAVALLHSPLGGADPLAERRLRQGLRALALAAGDRRPSGELLLDAVRDPAGLDMVERRWAAPAQNVAKLLAAAREAAAEPGATAEQVLWTVWRVSGLADRWYAMSTRHGPALDDPEVGRERQWRAEAADRDLDSMVVLFDAAARFVDRLPGARTEVFLDHVLGQDLPADSIAPSADRGEAVRLLTAHAAKGLEWDVVVLAGVQEGIWPDLRLRGSLLGSERLVDFLAGRSASGQAAVVGQTSALLDEERRLFYVAATRARRKLIATAVASAGVGGSEGEEQPSRFLTELAIPDTGPAGTGSRRAGPPGHRPARARRLGHECPAADPTRHCGECGRCGRRESPRNARARQCGECGRCGARGSPRNAGTWQCGECGRCGGRDSPRDGVGGGAGRGAAAAGADPCGARRGAADRRGRDGSDAQP